jgi:CrcB protein
MDGIAVEGLTAGPMALPVGSVMPQHESALADVRLLAVVSCGGVLGALARYGLQVAYPHKAGEFDWTILGVNASGCLLIGIIAVLITARPGTHRLVRPFLVTGVLGGYTTFSTYVIDIQRALVAGAPRTALLYGIATLATALPAAWGGMELGSALLARRSSLARRGRGEAL